MLAAIVGTAFISSAAIADIAGFSNLNPSIWSYNQADTETPADLPDPNTVNITGTSGIQTRSIFNNTRQGFSQFTASFTYQGNWGFNVNQGMSFILQNDGDGSNAIGGAQGELGYGGMANSIATTWDMRTNRIGFSTGGVVSGGVLVEGITLGGNNAIDFTLTYDGTFLTQQLLDTVTGVEFTQNLLVGDISSTLRDDLAYVGFGAASRQSGQVISNFSYTSVPTPGSIGVLSAGLLAASRRRRS